MALTCDTRVITGNPLPFLTFEQKDQITFIYSNVRQYLPRWMNKSFVIYKILDFILPEGPQRKLLSYIRLQSFATNKKKTNCFGVRQFARLALNNDLVVINTFVVLRHYAF